MVKMTQYPVSLTEVGIVDLGKKGKHTLLMGGDYKYYLDMSNGPTFPLEDPWTVTKTEGGYILLKEVGVVDSGVPSSCILFQDGDGNYYLSSSEGGHKTPINPPWEVTETKAGYKIEKIKV